jgi:HAD superfamily hydrolase (TIGR01450 family)
MSARLAQARAFLLDMDGTFFLGDQLLEGALDFIALLRQQGKTFLFLTNNSSKDRQQYVEKITRLGLPITAGQVLTSGEATARLLSHDYPGAKLFVVGTPSLENEFRAAGFALDDPQPDVAVVGFDTGLTYAKLWTLCNLVRAGRPYIVTHPDLNCPTPDGFMPDIGATIAYVKAATGRGPDQVVGKPSRLMAEAAAEKLGLPLASLAMVGDRLYTDIALGQAAGIPAVLVLSGETRLEDLRASAFQPEATFANLGALAAWLAAADEAARAEAPVAP